MKRFFVIALVAFMMCFVLAGCGQKADKPETQHYIQNGLSCEIPKAWTAVEKDGGIFYYYPENQGKPPFVMIAHHPLEVSIFDDSIFDSFIDGIREGTEEFSLIKQETRETEIGIPYAYMSASGIIAELNATFETAFFDCTDGVMAISMFAEEDSNDYSEDYKSILESVELQD